jgi:radical SAM superfamily enzyme YgiQ (UPF0313 family)
VLTLLLSTYELGRQPFGLASPAAWLRESGLEVAVADLSRTRLDPTAVEAAGLIGIFLPMHTATRLALPVLDRVRSLNPAAHICAYGIYAPANRRLLEQRGVGTVLGGEFEADLVALARALASGAAPPHVPEGRTTPRLDFRVPDRQGLPGPGSYAAIAWPDGTRRASGYTEASRGCKHRCRHCPVVPVYDGHFRVIAREVVLADVRSQVAAGAGHITFGDPDFFNGIVHARHLVTALAAEFPGLSYDVTIKVEHLLRHAADLALLRESGCAMVTAAIESVDDAVLARLEKGHTRRDVERVVELMRKADLPLVPTFVTFTPWTSLEAYLDLLATVDRLGLVDHVAPVQWSIRLLIPAGSRLLELEDVARLVGPFDPLALAFPWRHPDPRMDRLQAQVAALVGRRGSASRAETFSEVRELAHAAQSCGTHASPFFADAPPRAARVTVPYLTEPWFC